MAAITHSEDISTEILLRLPANSIIHLQFLSKLWLSIVSDPRFRQTHASRHITDATTATGLFFVGKDNHHHGRLGYLPMDRNNPKLSFHDIRLGPEDSLFTCTSSCNGLLLLRSLTFESGDIKTHTYYVYNPTTKEYKILDIPTQIRRNLLVTTILAFDPSESPHYKVVFFSKQDIRDMVFKIEIYSSMTKTFKSTHKYYYGDLDFDRNGVFCNGSIHWLTYIPTKLNSFDVCSESIHQLLAPGLCLPKYNVVRYFGQSRGHLYLVQSEDKSLVLKFYELKKDYSDWLLIYQIDRKYPGHIYRALSIFTNEEEDLTMVLLDGDEWVEHNIGKKKTATTKRFGKVPASYYNSCFPYSFRVSTHQFIPTLTNL